jgi:hypothetical protein
MAMLMAGSSIINDENCHHSEVTEDEVPPVVNGLGDEGGGTERVNSRGRWGNPQKGTAPGYIGVRTQSSSFYDFHIHKWP